MESIETLHQRLLFVAAQLDQAAGSIRDLSLNPVPKNVRQVGDALASIYEILRAIYAVRPDLVPERLDQHASDNEANARLTRALGHAYELLEARRTVEAVRLLHSFAKHETSTLHRDIATHEAARIESQSKESGV